MPPLPAGEVPALKGSGLANELLLELGDGCYVPAHDGSNSSSARASASIIAGAAALAAPPGKQQGQGKQQQQGPQQEQVKAGGLGKQKQAEIYRCGAAGAAAWGDMGAAGCDIPHTPSIARCSSPAYRARRQPVMLWCFLHASGAVQTSMHVRHKHAFAAALLPPCHQPTLPGPWIAPALCS